MNNLPTAKTIDLLRLCVRPLAIVCICYAIFAVVWRFTEAFLPSYLGSVFSFLAFIAIIVITSPAVKKAFFLFDNSTLSILKVLDRFSFWQIVLLGTALRIVWILSTDTGVISDGLSYFNHAKNLVFGGYYGFDGGQSEAHWPPGYPLILSPFMMVLGAEFVVVPVVNILLFLAAAAGLWKAAKLCYGDNTAKLAVAILSLWPNYIYISNIAAKESVVVTLIVWLAYFYFSYAKNSRYSYALFAGLTMGMMILAQPSTAVIAAAVVVTHVIATRKIMPGIVLSAVLLVGMIVIISPWTYRNYILLGTPVAVSYNGGDVFYRANNANAKPGYNAPTADSPTFGLPPLEKKALSYELGIEWIMNHPVDFMELAYAKGLLYLGNDDTSLWQFFEKKENAGRSPTYYAFHLLANGYWLIVLSLILYRLYLSKNSLDQYDHFLALCFFVLLFVELVFEAGTRHHLPLYPLMAIAFAKALLVNANETGQKTESLAT